ncbi:MAG: hypothetical protein NUW37_14675 [Planctomycetes bacterium]|nr:hypothetical protein [Planctomycetota bacterium]
MSTQEAQSGGFLKLAVAVAFVSAGMTFVTTFAVETFKSTPKIEDLNSEVVALRQIVNDTREATDRVVAENQALQEKYAEEQETARQFIEDVTNSREFESDQFLAGQRSYRDARSNLESEYETVRSNLKAQGDELTRSLERHTDEQVVEAVETIQQQEREEQRRRQEERAAAAREERFNALAAELGLDEAQKEALRERMEDYNTEASSLQEGVQTRIRDAIQNGNFQDIPTIGQAGIEEFTAFNQEQREMTVDELGLDPDQALKLDEFMMQNGPQGGMPGMPGGGRGGFPGMGQMPGGGQMPFAGGGNPQGGGAAQGGPADAGNAANNPASGLRNMLQGLFGGGQQQQGQGRRRGQGNQQQGGEQQGQGDGQNSGQN